MATSIVNEFLPVFSEFSGFSGRKRGVGGTLTDDQMALVSNITPHNNPDRNRHCAPLHSADDFDPAGFRLPRRLLWCIFYSVRSQEGCPTFLGRL